MAETEKIIKKDEVLNPIINIPMPSLAMVFSPYQEWIDIYDSDVGIERGTIFKQLDKPFIGEIAKMESGD